MTRSRRPPTTIFPREAMIDGQPHLLLTPGSDPVRLHKTPAQRREEAFQRRIARKPRRRKPGPKPVNPNKKRPLKAEQLMSLRTPDPDKKM